MIRRFLTNRWFLGALGLFALTVVVYFLGPFFAFGNWRPLESTTARWIFILLVVIIWLARRIRALMKAEQAEKQMVSGIVEAPVVEEQDLSAEEIDKLKNRFEDAVSVLKKSKGKSSRLNLYDLPWYIIIGPPGSGKTTALLNSGLRFPLEERFGPEAIKGVGGTRDCDWWFTEEAVLIDTAGRYTTQDSDAQIDQAAWLGFLDLLKKYRKRRPINGVFVAISIRDLLTQTEMERRDHIRAIRERILELDGHFGIRFPVYVLFTKFDLVSGFSEFFDDQGKADREQVWGATFPYSDSENEEVATGFDAEFDHLLRRVNQRLIDRINQEPDLQRRILIHGFPKQIGMLKENLGSFLKEVFENSRYETAPLLRGFYFTSGTQEGTPIDRLMGSLATTFQLDPQSMPAYSGGGKSYFITNVLRKVVFGESEIAGTNRRIELRRAWMTNAAYVGVAAALVLVVMAWSYGYQQEKSDIMAAGILADEASTLVSGIDQRNLDPLVVLPMLQAARKIPGGYEDQTSGSTEWRFGLSQESKIGDVAVAGYHRLLEQMLLPRIMLRLENQLQRGGASPDYTYEALKAYLMFDSRDHYDPMAIRAFLEYDWVANLRREVSTEQREALLRHLDALLEERVVPLPLPLDESIIQQSRREVRGLPLEYRIYGRLKRATDVSVPGFNVRAAAGGSESEFVFVRKSGLSLGEPLPALFTKKAYQQVFIERSRRITSEITDESWWILGEEEEINQIQQEQLLSRVRDLYLDEFATEYSNLIEDIDLAPFNTPEEAMRILNILSRPEDSPLLSLLKSIAAETTLDQLEDDASLAARAESSATEALNRVQELLGTQRNVPDTVAEALITNTVQQRFRSLNALVDENDGQPRPVDRLLGLFRELYVYMSNVASESAGGAIPPRVQSQGQAVTQQLKMEAASHPDLLIGDLLNSSADRSIAMTTGGLLAYLNDLWQSGPLQICQQAIASRYPIVPDSNQTIRIDDFGQFFGYGGTMDNFFDNHLRQYVDSTRVPWQPRQTGNIPLRLSDSSLRAFEYADVIKRTFFRIGSTQPSVSFDLRPLEMDTSLSQFLLDLEGKVITYEFGPKTPTFMQWPGPNPGSEVRVEIRNRQTGQTTMDRRQGPWAWFRLLDESSFRSTSIPEQFEIVFNLSGREVTYDLIARSAFNPFSLSQLRDFRCPRRL